MLSLTKEYPSRPREPLGKILFRVFSIPNGSCLFKNCGNNCGFWWRPFPVQESSWRSEVSGCLSAPWRLCLVCVCSLPRHLLGEHKRIFYERDPLLFGSWCKCKGCWSGKILLKILFRVFSIPNDSCLSKNCMAHLLFDISSSSILLPLCMRCFEKRITVHLKSSLNLLSSACMKLWGLLLLIHWTDWCRILMQKYKTVVNLMWYKWFRDGHSEILKCKKYKNI